MIQTKKQKHLPIVVKKLGPFIDPTLKMWSFPSQEYKKADMSKLLSKIRAIRIYSLVISSNREVRIVKDIHNVSFPNLSILDLTDNAIESIQQINRMQFPRLKTLILDYNLITKMPTFRKAFFYQLSHINLIGNRIMTLKPFHQYYSLTLTHLNLKYNRYLNDISTMVLLQFPLSILFMEHLGGFERKQLHQIIDDEKKFPNKRKFRLK